MKTSSSALSKLVTNAKASMQPAVKLNAVVKTKNEGYARVVATVTKAVAQSPAQALSLISNHIQNKMRPIPESFSVLASDNVNVTITGIMTSNSEAVAYSEGMEGYRAVAGNMFLDESENVWSLHKSEAGSLLIRARTREDEEVVGEVMKAVASATIGTSASTALNEFQSFSNSMRGIEGGDFALYVDPNSGSVRFGAIATNVLNSDNSDSDMLCVLSNGSEESFLLDRQLVLQVVEASEIEIDDTDLFVESTSSAGHSLDDIISYYSRVFQRDPAYFDKFIARWKGHNFG